MKLIKNSFIALMLLSYASMAISMEQPNPSYWQRFKNYFSFRSDIKLSIKKKLQKSLLTDSQLLNKYAIPSELEEQLNYAAEYDETFKKEISAERYFVCKCPNDLPCYIKGWNFTKDPTPFDILVPRRQNISRIENLEDLERAKNEVAPDDLMLPTKFFWHMKNRGLELNDFNYFIVSEELKQADGTSRVEALKDINSEQLNKVCLFLRESKFKDAAGRNLFFTFDYSGKEFWKKNYQPQIVTKKRIACIDTEIHEHHNFENALDELAQNVGYTNDRSRSYMHPVIYAHYLSIQNRIISPKQNNSDLLAAYGFGC